MGLGRRSGQVRRGSRPSAQGGPLDQVGPSHPLAGPRRRSCPGPRSTDQDSPRARRRPLGPDDRSERLWRLGSQVSLVTQKARGGPLRSLAVRAFWRASESRAERPGSQTLCRAHGGGRRRCHEPVTSRSERVATRTLHTPKHGRSGECASQGGQADEKGRGERPVRRDGLAVVRTHPGRTQIEPRLVLYTRRDDPAKVSQ